MESRRPGRTHRQVAVIGLGCWQLGADCSDVSEAYVFGLLHAAGDAGVELSGQTRGSQVKYRTATSRPAIPQIATIATSIQWNGVPT